MIITCAPPDVEGKVYSLAFSCTSDKKGRHLRYPEEWHKLNASDHAFLKHDTYVDLCVVYKGDAEGLLGKKIIAGRLSNEESRLIQDKVYVQVEEIKKTIFGPFNEKLELE